MMVQNDSGDDSVNNGGDVLARGGRSAQFAAAGGDLTDFEYDLRARQDIVAEKYGLSEAEVFQYIARLENGERLDMKPAETTLGSEIMVIDRRPNFLGAAREVKEAVSKVEQKYPDKDYSPFQPIMDRILIKRCADDKDMKLMEDGSILNQKTGLIIAAKYRQHSNVGIVLATGEFVILSGQKIPMADVVRVGDKVTFGDYNSEVFPMTESKVRELCDRVQMNYFPDEEGIRVVRVQDVRGIERAL
jgi:co-chaperonin GroES (HSP10)